MEAQEKTLQLSIVTPAETVYDGAVETVQIPMHDGLIGVLPNHAPLLGVLGVGVLNLRVRGEEQQVIVDGGFLEIRDNRVTVLANGAESVADIDFEAAQAAYDAATAETANSDDEIEAKLDRVAGARARLKFKS